MMMAEMEDRKRAFKESEEAKQKEQAMEQELIAKIEKYTKELAKGDISDKARARFVKMKAGFEKQKIAVDTKKTAAIEVFNKLKEADEKEAAIKKAKIASEAKEIEFKNMQTKFQGFKDKITKAKKAFDTDFAAAGGDLAKLADAAKLKTIWENFVKAEKKTKDEVNRILAAKKKQAEKARQEKIREAKIQALQDAKDDKELLVARVAKLVTQLSDLDTKITAASG